MVYNRFSEGDILKNRFLKITAAVFALGAAFAVLRAVLVVNYIEKSSFESGAYSLPDNAPLRIFAVACALFCLAAFVFAFVKSRKKLCVPEQSAAAPAAAAFAVALAFIVQAAMFVVYCAENRIEPDAGNIIENSFALAASLLFFLPLGVRFIRGSKKPLPEFTAFIPVLYCCARLLSDFIRINAAPMESSGAYHILSLAALLMLLTAESASRFRKIPPLRFIAFGFPAVVFLLVYALPNLALPAYGLLDFDLLTVTSVGDICLAFYCAARIATCTKCRIQYTCATNIANRIQNRI